MASTKIRGITIELNADTAGILDGLKDINSSLSTTQRALNDTNKLLKLDPENVTLLAQKEEYLTKAIEGTEQKLERQKELLEQLRTAENSSETIEQQKALEREIEATTQKLDSYKGELDKTQDSLKGMGESAEKSSKSIDSTAEAIQAIAQTEAFTQIAESAKQLYEALMACDEAADKFEYSMAKVETLAHAGTGLDKMADEIKSASLSLGVSSSQMAEAVYQAMSAGVDSANSIEFAAEASRLATAGFTDTATAVDIVTTAINAYGLEMSDSTHIMDNLITTQNLGKTTVAELATAMGKVIPTASAYSVNIDQLATAYAELTAKGIRTRETTTYLNAMFGELGNAEKEVNKVLKELTGQTFGQFMESGNSLGDVMKLLWEYADEDKESFMGLWSTTQAGKAAFNIASDGGSKFNDILGQMTDNAGELDKAFEIMAGTSEMLDAKFNTAIENMQIAIGDALGPMLDELKEKGLAVLEPVTAFIEENPKVVAAIGGMVTGIVGMTTAVTACATAVALLKLALGDITGIAAILGGAAIVGGIAGLSSAIDSASTSTDELRKNISKTKSALDETNSAYDKNITDMHNLLQTIQRLNSEENLSAENKVKLASAVEQWNSAMDENNQLLIDETGHIQDLNGALEDNLDLAYKQYVLAKNEERRADILSEYAQAQENLADAQEKLTAATDKYNQMLQDSEESAYAWKGQVEEASRAVEEAEEANRALEEEYNSLTNAINNSKPAVEESTAAMEAEAEASRQVEEANEKLVESYEKAKESALNSLESQREEFEKLNLKAGESVTQITKTLTDQANGMTEYAELIKKAYEIMQKEPESSDLLAYYIQQGPAAAGELKNLVDAADGTAESFQKFSEAVAAFNETTDLMENISEMTAGIEVGWTEPIDNAIASLTTGTETITSTLQECYATEQSDADDNRKAMNDTAVGTMGDIEKAVTDNTPKVVTATKKMIEESVKQVKTSLEYDDSTGRSGVFYTLGMNVDQSIADGMTDNQSVVSSALQSVFNNAINSLDLSGISARINAKLGESF